MKSEMVNFRPQGRHLSTIGKDLINDKFAAVVELVKNSYDADSEKVDIRFSLNKVKKIRIINNADQVFSEDELEIVIQDYGHGMSRDVILKKWIVPSTNNKVKKELSPLGRTFQGRKGIGRYAASILGESLEIVTVDIVGEKTEVKIDWSEFEKAEFLDEVKFEVNSSESKEDSGTKITIKGSQEFANEWDEFEIQTLIYELKKLKTPETFNEKGAVDREDQFAISVFLSKEILNESYDRTISIEPYPIFDLFDYRVHGNIFKNGECSFEYINSQTGEKELINFPYQEEIICGNLAIDIRAYDREPAAIGHLISRGLRGEDGEPLKKIQARKLLDKFVGIGVYRNGFRIRPMGEPDFDWLELNSRRIQQPSLRLGLNQVIGQISIESEQHSNLEEKSARDGLKHTKSYEQLVKISHTVIALMEERRFNSRRSLGQSRSNRNINDKVNRLFEYASLKKEIAKKLKEKGIDQSIGSEVENLINKDENEKNQIADEIKNAIATYQGQATLGKVINILLHEGRRPLNFFENQIDNLTYWMSNIDGGKKDEALREITQITLGISTNSKALVSLFKKINPLATGKRGMKKDFKFKKVVEDSYNLFEKIIQDEKINLKINIHNDVVIHGWQQDFNTILFNLIDNSIYWLQDIKEKEITIDAIVEDSKVIIEYRDNGPGIKSIYIKNQDIFEPEFSTKPNGTGLGLAISGEAAVRNNFDITALESSSGAYFIIESKDNI